MMKLPNGFGTVYKLSGNRRRPYVVKKTIDGRGNVFVGLATASWFRSSAKPFCGTYGACVNKPGTILGGTILCRIEPVVMAMTSHFIGGTMLFASRQKQLPPAGCCCAGNLHRPNQHPRFAIL